MAENERIPTPLVIIAFKVKGEVTEVTRFRGEPETLFQRLYLGLAEASLQDVDECIIRVLRPTYE